MGFGVSPGWGVTLSLCPLSPPPVVLKTPWPSLPVTALCPVVPTAAALPL